MGIRDRLNRLRPQGDCETCGAPSSRGREIELRMNVILVKKDSDGVIRQYDPDTGEPYIPPEPEPCPECGRVQKPVRVKGIQDKPRNL
jgi:endogenous inhibitor of DNA gyrase (YacG/DUF329 family)